MSQHVMILGGGAVGLTSAIALLRAGHKVTLVERGTPGKEASWAGGGILSPLCSWDYQDAVTRLTERSMALFPEAMDALRDNTGIDPEYRHSGMLLIPPYRQEAALSWCAARKVELQQTDLSAHLPHLSGDALFMPNIGQVRNPRLLAALKRQVEMLGGVILEQHEVLRLEIKDDRVTGLITAQTTLHADAYLLAAGAWSSQLLGEHALSLKVHPVRGQILLFKFDAPPFNNILLQDNLYLIPRADGHVLIGSTLEEAGFDKSTTTEARNNLLQRVHTLFPEWENKQPVLHWAGLRPGSADNIPTLGRHPQLSNLYANCGHFRYGVTMSLACAELLLNEIEHHPQPLKMDEYRWRE